MKMNFHSHVNKTHFHMKGCAPGLAFKKRQDNSQMAYCARHSSSEAINNVNIFVLLKKVFESLAPGIEDSPNNSLLTF